MRSWQEILKDYTANFFGKINNYNQIMQGLCNNMSSCRGDIEGLLIQLRVDRKVYHHFVITT